MKTGGFTGWFLRTFGHLNLLLWRNTLIRWRGGSVTLYRKISIPVFHLVEILWPLILYIILVILRQKFPPENEPDSKYRALALPSAGTLPFLQSLICDFGAEADEDPFSDMPTYPNATVNEVYGILDDVGNWNASWTKLCDSFHELAGQASCLSQTSGREGCYSGSRDAVPVTCYVKDPDEFRDFLHGNLSLSESVVDGILGATVNVTEVGGITSGRLRRQADAGSLLSLLQTFNFDSSSLRFVICNSNQWYDIIHFSNISAADVQDAVCQLSDSQWDELSSELQKQIVTGCSPVEVAQSVSQALALQELIEQTDVVDMFEDFSNTEWTEGDNGAEDAECEDSLDNYIPYFCGSVRSKPNEILKSILKRSCYGDTYKQAARDQDMVTSNETSSDSVAKNSLKILYTPGSNLTLSIIKKANRTFESVGELVALAQQVSNCSQYFLDNFPPERLAGVREVLAELIEYKKNGGVSDEGALDVTSLLPNVSLADLQRTQDLLNDSTPDNIWAIMTVVHNVSQQIYDTLEKFDWDVFMMVKDEKELEELAGDYQRQDQLGITYVVAGIVFDSSWQDPSVSRIRNATVKIRTNFSSVVDPSQYKESIWYPGPEDEFWKKRYIDGFFIFIQDMIERAVAEEIVGDRVASPGLYLQEMPYPCYKKDRFTISLLYVLPLAMLFAWLFPVAMTTRAVVREKETRLKEFMKMMGVGEGLLRLSWLIHSLVVFFISVLFITVLLKVGGILPATDWTILLLYLTVYAVVMLSYSFMVSAFFNNANLAACVASLLYFMVFFGHVTIVPNMGALSPVVIGISCLWAPLAFGLGSTYLVQWELQQKGLQWSNIDIPPIEDDHLSFLVILLIMVFDAVLYFVFTWYIEGVFPGRYGVAKPWYFPFIPSYWCGQKQWNVDVGCVLKRAGQVRHVTLQEDGEEMTMLSGQAGEVQGENCEEEPEGLPLGISIQNMSKKFVTGLIPGRRRHTLAVNNLSLNFYEGQITAFLGHNGAGKTTTMSVLTGLFEPSSGTAHIYGNNIRRHMDIIRQNLGICPQHNILFDNLTVKEHLIFYGMLKGLSLSEARDQVPIWLEKVDLCNHSHKFAKHLSGGMKRRLSVLLAFVGKCKTVILDEPTSGVDPFARRQIWDFLLRHRTDRTIMLSTHHMDEAEILGDRIAIISNGSLLCCGSFEYLKHRFGHGHRLTIVARSQSERRPSLASRTFTVTADVEETDTDSLSTPISLKTGSDVDIETGLTSFLQSLLPGATLIEQRGHELHYSLPLNQARPRVLSNMFTQLEEQKEKLGVASYGLTSCSMEEIFVQLTEQELMEKNEANVLDSSAPTRTLSSRDSQTSLEPSLDSQVDKNEEDVFDEGLLFGDKSCDDPLGSNPVDSKRLTGARLWLLQFYSLLVKRVHYTKGKLVALTIQNIFPLIVICLSLLIARSLQSVPDPPALELSPYLFFAKSRYNYLFVGGCYNEETEATIDSLFSPYGVSAHRPTGGSTEDRFCSGYPQHQYNCQCDSCEIDDLSNVNEHIPSCYNETVTGSRVLNITQACDSQDSLLVHKFLSNYLLRSSQSFIEQRYGGLSFGHFREEVPPMVDQINSNSSSTLPFLATHLAAKVWYRLKGYHAMPAYLNTMNNAIMRGNMKNESYSEYGIRTISHPFKLTDLEKILYAITENVSFLVNPLAAMFSLGFVVAGFVLLLIEERSGNIKHLQLVCGLNKTVYWICAYVWDLLWYCTFVLLILILYLIFQDPYYTGTEEMPLFFVILLCYGMAAIPWMYMLSFLFTSPATAYVLLFCLNFFAGFAFLLIDAIVVQLEERPGGDLIHYTLVWVPFPSYALGRSMMYLSLDWPLTREFIFSDAPSPYSKLSPFLMSLLFQFCLYTAIIFLVEAIPLILNKMCSSKLPLSAPADEDDTVAAERRRVSRGDHKGDLLVLKDVTKIYGTTCNAQHRLAVNQLCLQMKKAECFGLLGVNGAGKTTTFRMLTGDIRMTSGEASVAAHCISNGSGALHRYIGYCPQVDALIDQLTGRQHLVLFSRLRGLPTAEVSAVSEWALIKLGLKEHADKLVKTYSGGNRRKLSTAIALLARPALILLDEPTSGVDPRARRFLWTIVRSVISAGQSVLLTTHSMAECEALCSRVGIMVNGSFRCLGSPQQLKSKYGEGYNLKVRILEQVEALKEFIRQNLTAACLKEEHFNTLIYQLPGAGLDIPMVYDTMERARETLEIQDYTLSQTSLDDVFIHFANEQSEDAGLEVFSSTNREDLPVNRDMQLPDIVAGIQTSS